MDGQEQGSRLPAPARDFAPAPLLSDTVARHVEELLAASEDAAKAIEAKARADAETLARAATQAALAEAQRTAGSQGTRAELEQSVSELREEVQGLRAHVERLTTEMELLAGPEAPSLPPPQQRTDTDRRALLIAFNMASNGASRVEAARYLREHLGVEDCEPLLDAVYAHVGSEGGGPPET
jgi:hypothetical protein